MRDKERQVRARKNWLRIYQELGSVSKAALRCGVARSTMYRWIKRYNEEGETGLSDKSKRPKTLSNSKISPEMEALILDIRSKKKWGSSTYLHSFITEENQALCNDCLASAIQKQS